MIVPISFAILPPAAGGGDVTLVVYAHGKYLIEVWPNDHRPVHVHVEISNESTYKITLPSYSVEHLSGKYISTDEIKEIIQIVKDNRNTIGKAWRRFHGN